jgi:putative Ca2+/H+ antiporter (TMEM165/GDT1 family)
MSLLAVMQSLLVSTGVVAVSEIGDKTQLLALVLASRFQKPVPIIFGILTATLANHVMAAWVGQWTAGQFSPDVLRWALGLMFIGMAVWSLVPDKLDEDEAVTITSSNIFFVTTVSFFLAEMGDKTQLATAALAARFHEIIPVVMGTTLGMLLADVPAVFGGHLAGNRLNLKYVRWATAVIFATLGVYTLF